VVSSNGLEEALLSVKFCDDEISVGAANGSPNTEPDGGAALREAEVFTATERSRLRGSKSVVSIGC
jgi:hypothetical protein